MNEMNKTNSTNKINMELVDMNITTRIKNAPKQIKLNFKLINLYCWLKDNPTTTLYYTKIARMFNISDSTVRRFLNKEFKGHKLLHDFINKSKICEIKDEKERFVIYMLDHVLKNLSLHTIKKNKFFNDFYKLGVHLGKIKYQSLYSNDFEKDIKQSKRDLKDLLKKQKKFKKQKITDPIKLPKSKSKKINILATTKSSESLKQLAKDFSCNIKEIDNRFDKHTELVHSTNPGKYYH